MRAWWPARGVYRFDLENSSAEVSGPEDGSCHCAAEIAGIDRETDLALVKIAIRNLRTLRLADSSQLRQRQVVFAVGSPMGMRNWVSTGILSAEDRQLDEDANQAYLQTDAPINPGNSGQPLIKHPRRGCRDHDVHPRVRRAVTRA